MDTKLSLTTKTAMYELNFDYQNSYRHILKTLNAPQEYNRKLVKV